MKIRSILLTYAGFIFIVFPQILHAEMSAIEIDTFNNQMLTKLSATNYFEFKEISSKGELKACSLEFGYVYRNYVKFSGNIVQLAGSFNQ